MAAVMLLVLFQVLPLVVAIKQNLCSTLVYQRPERLLKDTQEHLGYFFVTLDEDLRTSADNLQGKFTECLSGYLINLTDFEIQTAFKHFQLLESAKKTLIIHSESFENQFVQEVQSIHRNFHVIVHSERRIMEFPILQTSGWRGKQIKVHSLNIWPFLYDNDDGSMSGADWELINGILEHYGMTFTMERSTAVETVELDNGTSYGYLYNVSSNNWFFQLILEILH